MDKNYINIKELGLLIKKSLPKDNIYLTAEVRQPKISNGHMFLNLKDSDGLVNSIIWKSNVSSEIRNLIDGTKISVCGKLDYYNGNGRLSFIINSVDEIKGEGELKKAYELLKSKFTKKGYFLEDSKLKVPEIIKKILILSSENGDAIKDFYHCIENNNLILDNDFINVSVQGVDCPKQICKILKDNDINNHNYDLIVLTRGGGSFEDLFGFCQKELIKAVYKCDIPVLSAVGHKEDTTLVDYVSDYVCATPSLAGQFIVDHNKKYVDKLNFKKNSLLEEIKKDIFKKLNYLNTLTFKIYNQKDNLLNYKTEMKNKIISNINTNLIILENYLVKYTIEDNIKIYNDNKEIKTESELIKSLKNKDNIKILINNNIVNIFDYLK
tara:strand:+ start:178 stop:1323 length:1146 start_codon:yes stop_codon:yes gene_type:complete